MRYALEDDAPSSQTQTPPPTDGGLVNAPIPVIKMKLCVGERVEPAASFGSEAGDELCFTSMLRDPAAGGGPYECVE